MEESEPDRAVGLLVRSIAVTAMTEAQYVCHNDAVPNRDTEMTQRRPSYGLHVVGVFRYFCTGAMPAAEYAHYGLALQYYTHFTYAGGWSHIRRTWTL